MTLQKLFAGLCLAVLMAGTNQAAANNRLVVYVECSNPKKPELPVFKGTGVVISEEGHVLTAEHVVPEGYECVGALENNTIARRQLQVDFKDYQLSEKIDGKLLRFIASSGEVFEYATYCPATAGNVGDVIVVKGFHGKSKGLPSATLGILSTYIPNPRGILETDAQTVGGKSGGPVFLQNTNTIIGIVAGAEFDPSGLPAYYGVLTAEALAQFGVLQVAQNCGGPAKSDDLLASPASPAPALAEQPATEPTVQPVAATATPTEAPAAPTAVEEMVAAAKTQESLPAAAASELSPAQTEDAMQMSKSDRVLVQQSLTALGFNTRGIDGIWGANTRKAIANWQTAMSHEPTGFLDHTQTRNLITTAAKLVEAKKQQQVAAKPSVSSAPKSTAGAEALYNQAYILYDEGDFQKAIALLDQAIQTDPNNAKYLAERGYNHYEIGKFTSAIADLSSALKLNPRDDDALATRGWAYLEINRLNRAETDFKNAAKLNPGNEDATDGLAELCDFAGRC